MKLILECQDQVTSTAETSQYGMLLCSPLHFGKLPEICKNMIIDDLTWNDMSKLADELYEF